MPKITQLLSERVGTQTSGLEASFLSHGRQAGTSLVGLAKDPDNKLQEFLTLSDARDESSSVLLPMR